MSRESEAIFCTGGGNVEAAGGDPLPHGHKVDERDKSGGPSWPHWEG